jgi:trigger factor
MIDVAVDAEALEGRIDRAAKSLANEMKLPGFRKGKVPPQLVIQRIGREAVVEQALREGLPEWYERALLESGVTPIGDPKLDVGDLPPAGEELAFTIEVGIRPKAELGDYRGLEVGRAEVEVPEDALDAELDRLREGFGSLSPVDRPAAAGDAVMIDFAGTIDAEPFEGSEGRDFTIELGAQGLLPEFDAALTGAASGDQRTAEVTFPDDHQPAELAGKTASFEITVKEVREKDLPDLDDDFAAEASEFDTLEELRADIGKRLEEAVGQRAEQDFRVAAVDAAAAEAKLELPDDLATARATERWERVERQLAGRGMSPDSYLQMQGKTREQVIEESRPEAEAELKREAVLAAIADAEAIEASEEEMLEALAHSAEHERTTPEKLLKRLRESGREAMIRDDIRFRKAIDLVAESAKPIPLEQAEAREKIWTPEKERKEAGSLWTPDSE